MHIQEIPIETDWLQAHEVKSLLRYFRLGIQTSSF